MHVSTENAPALLLQEVTKRYGAFLAVDRLSLRVQPGEVLGFLGPNGAGKTSTIRMIMGITRPDSGTLSILGRGDALELRDRIGYLPEERGLYRKMTVEQTLRYLGRLKGVPRPELDRRIDEQLERIGLRDWKKKRVEALSKGMQQKVQFVACILHRPELVILDEPFSGLDPLNADLLVRLLQEMRAARVTVIFSTHQMETAERLCDRIVLINRGRKLIEGPLAEVRGQFAARHVVVEGAGDLAALAHAPGVLSAQISGGQARLEVAEGVDSQALLRRALELARITRFELQRPTLQEVFVTLVGGDTAPEAAAGLRPAGRGALAEVTRA